jgi:hypothetical protein
VRIATAGNKTSWFVQENRQAGLWPNDSVIDFDVIGFLNLDAEVSRRLAINRDAPGSNQLIAMTPGTEASGSEKAIKAQEM